MAWSDEARAAALEARRSGVKQHPLAKANAHVVHQAIRRVFPTARNHWLYRQKVIAERQRPPATIHKFTNF